MSKTKREELNVVGEGMKWTLFDARLLQYAAGMCFAVIVLAVIIKFLY